jgi:hypothetical protein
MHNREEIWVSREEWYEQEGHLKCLSVESINVYGMYVYKIVICRIFLRSWYAQSRRIALGLQVKGLGAKL